MIKMIYNALLHLLLVASVAFGVSQCNKATEISNQYNSNKEIFDQANKIVDIKLREDSSKITVSKPHETILSPAAITTKNLLDSVSKDAKLSSNERIISYNKIPIKSSVKLKATHVNNEYAETENENWYARYYLRDSVFDLKYKTVYNNILTEKEFKLLGLNLQPNKKFSYDWIVDRNADILKPTTVIVNKKHNKNKFQIYNTNKFRSFDNSVLSGAEVSVDINRLNLSGQYLYNFNYNKPEYEVSIKYGIFKP